MNCGHGFPPFLGPSLTKGGAKKGKKAGQNLKIHHSGEVMSSKTKKSPPELRWVSGTVARLLSHSSPRKLENKHPKSKPPKSREPKSKTPRFKNRPRKTNPKGHNWKAWRKTKTKNWHTNNQNRHINHKEKITTVRGHQPSGRHQGVGEPDRRHGQPS